MKEILSDFNLFCEQKVQQNLNDFETYYDLLISFNKMFNLTAITEREEVFVKHFADSVSGIAFIDGEKLIDVGSGGGFPAIPLKIVNKNLNLTMLEATGKKCEFLKTVCEKLNLKNTTVINGRAEELSQKSEFRESFDCCTARAVARLNILAEYCLPFIKVGGKFVCYKSALTDEELLESKNALKVLGGEVESVNKFDLNGQSRSIIVIKKVKPTDKKYPRSNANIRKKPL